MVSSEGDNGTAAPIPLVGVGASAGGFAALEAFFAGLPPSPGMAFIVVVHLLPEVESHLAELLQRRTGLTVRQVKGKAPIKVDHVYVIPPDYNLVSLDGGVELLPRRPSGSNRSPIDLLFSSVAESHGRRSAGVILSGSGSDGAVGLARIREAGGVTLVQDPDEAGFPETPRAALRGGVVDGALSAALLGPEVVRLLRTELDGNPRDGERENPMEGLIHLLCQATGLSFHGYRTSSLQRRIRRRLPMVGARDLEEYRNHLERHPEEVEHLARDILIGVTRFFRDPEVFEALSDKVLSPLVERAATGDPIRIWVAGCSTGEEAYSLAMLLEEVGGEGASPENRIFATDVDPAALETARKGVYPQGVALDVSPERLARHFEPEAQGYRIKEALRGRVLFATHDLLADPPFSSLDLVVCRNVLIYLKPEFQERVLGLFHYSLRTSGHLLLGASEAADQVPELFVPVDPRHRIYRSLPGEARPSLRTFRSGPTAGSSWPNRSPRGVPPPPSAPAPGVLHHDLVELYAPPSLLVDEDLRVIHLSRSVGRYLSFRGGEPGPSLPDLLPEDVGGEIRVLVQEAMRSLGTVTGSVMVVGNGGKVRAVVRGHRPDAGGERLALVVFHPADDEEPVPPPRRSEGGAGELASLRLQLRQAVEAHDRTLQEYRTAYAELQAINEEQKVTGEELESSKEELQSVNEELRAINEEHREKIEQLAGANADLKNLIDSAEVALIFLDRELRIRRFTPSVAEVFRFRPSDVGRPVEEIASTLHYPRLWADVRQVLEDEQRVRQEVEAEDGRWYMVQLVPYRSFGGNVEGVVITFLEVTRRKRNEAEMERLLAEARRAELARSNLFGMLAHEFREPLKGLEEAAGELGPGGSAEERGRLSHRILTVTARVRRMLDEMLQGREDHPGTHTTGVDATRVVTETVELLQTRASERGVRLVSRVDSSLPATSTDGWRLHRLTAHLVENAVVVTGSGDILVHLMADPPWLVLEVRDGGPPLPPPLLDWLTGEGEVEPELPGDRAHHLRAIRNMAGRASGRLEVTCPEGKGCCFRVHLPLPHAPRPGGGGGDG